MWEENPEIFFNEEVLLPLAPLAATKQPPILLQQVAQRINQLAVEKRAKISAAKTSDNIIFLLCLRSSLCVFARCVFARDIILLILFFCLQSPH
nr:hypothetical protein [Pleurocapsa sp. PCC 7327]